MTTAEVVTTHEWRLVAPWWDWPLRGSTDPNDPGEPAARRSVRVSRPALQMYDSPDLVNVFLSDPQLRLAFDPDTDEVWDVTAPNFGTFPQRTPTHRRKLFLASHHRNYLVVCSLHCNAAGFPQVRTDEICQVGLVVRRRRIDLPDGPQGEVARALRQHAVARSKRAAVERRLAAMRPANGGAVRSAVLESRLRSLKSAEQDARDLVLQWVQSGGQVRRLEGWIPTGVDAAGHRGPMPGCGSGPARTAVASTGSWQPVEELPETLTEAAYPLSPLVPDPTNPATTRPARPSTSGSCPPDRPTSTTPGRRVSTITAATRSAVSSAGTGRNAPGRAPSAAARSPGRSRPRRTSSPRTSISTGPRTGR